MQYHQVLISAFVVAALGVSSVSAQTNVTNCTSCDNFANCTTITSTLFTCTCQTNYIGNGTNCYVQADITCSQDVVTDGYAMQIRVKKAYFDHHGYTIGNLRLLNASCVPIISGDDYLFEVPNYSSCGTIQTSNSSTFVFSNVISTDGGIVVRPVITIDTRCVLGSTVSISPSGGNSSGLTIIVPPQQSITFTSTGEAELTVTMFLYENEQYTTPFNGVPVLTTTDMIFAEIQVRPITNFVVVVEECWGTPSSNRDDSSRYDIITSPGCMASGVYDGLITSNGASSVGRFQLQVFKWITTSTVYLHCMISLCDSNGNSTCQPTCPGSRRKRDLFSNDLDHRGLISSILILRENRHIKIPDQIPNLRNNYVLSTQQQRTFSSTTTELIIAITVSGFLLIVIIALLTGVWYKKRTTKVQTTSIKVFPPTSAS